MGSLNRNWLRATTMRNDTTATTDAKIRLNGLIPTIPNICRGIRFGNIIKKTMKNNPKLILAKLNTQSKPVANRKNTICILKLMIKYAVINDMIISSPRKSRSRADTSPRLSVSIFM